MVSKRTASEYVFDIFNYIFLTFLALITLYPFLYVAFASFSEGSLFMAHRGILLSPLDFNIESYKMVFKNPSIMSGYANTLFIVIVGTSINIVASCIGAYVLARKEFYWKNIIATLIVFTMFFGGGLIPTFLLVRDLGMLGSKWALIIPSMIGTYNMILIRTAIQGIGDELIESARLDGANEFTVLFKIIIPLITPTIAVMVLRYGVGHWNSWFGAMIYLSGRREEWPLQLLLREILVQNNLSDMLTGTGIGEGRADVAQTIKYATVMVATVPILCVYPFLQRYFVKGIMVGALKG